MDYLKLSISSGTTLYDSLIILKDSIENDLYKISIENSIKKMEDGEQFSDTLIDSKLFTKFTIRVIKIGEFSGSLDEEFEMLANLYYKKVNNIAAIIPKIAQTAALLVGGLMMGIIIIGLMGPIYELIGKI